MRKPDIEARERFLSAFDDPANSDCLVGPLAERVGVKPSTARDWVRIYRPDRHDRRPKRRLIAKPTAAAHEIIADPLNIEIVDRVVKKLSPVFVRCGMTQGDVHAAGMRGLFFAAINHRPGTDFPPYLLLRVRGEIISDARRWRFGPCNRQLGAEVVPLDALSSSGDEKADYLGVVPDDPAESADLLVWLVDLAPPASRPAMRAIYLNASTANYSAAATALGVPTFKIKKDHAAGVAAIRAELARRGIHSRAELENAS